MMRLKPEMDPDDLIGRLRMERMSTNDNLSRLLGSVPEIASAIALGQSFRVVMPPGVLGHLMTHVNNPALKGLKMTTVVSNGSTAGAAGLASMAGFVAPLLIWTVLSFITGQFFLTQIQRNTQAIFEELRNILYFLVAKEESDLRARVEFLQYVSANFHALSQNDEMRHATLVNLQKTNLDSLSGLKLWVFHVEKELQEICDAVQLVKQGKDKRGNAEKVAGLVGTTRQNITRAITSWQCYALGSTLEIQLGQAFEPSLLEYTKQSLRKQSLDLRNALGKAENIWSDFKNISYFSESAKFELGKIHAVGEELAGYSNRVKESLISATKYLISIEDLESRGTGLLYYNGAFYRPDQDAVLSMKASKSSESIMSGS
ncbi:MAG: hypothetical protein EA367_14525 [Leptolyngbya sp. DLM2.Bin15]|nr:MAG: hypothetical protein EA367_14525 [Leptolyngbya sp. DLM2.Bin15]